MSPSLLSGAAHSHTFCGAGVRGNGVRTPKRVVRTRGPELGSARIPRGHRQASLRVVVPRPSIGQTEPLRPGARKDIAVELFWLITVPIVIILAVLTIVDIVRRRRPKVALWILLVIVFPVIGSLIYWATRKPTVEEAELAYMAETDVRAHNQQVPSDRAGF
jgi:hypothetical protein